MANLGFPFDPATVERPCGFADLPDIPAIQRLKSRRQWVSWKYLQRGDANVKPTKPLYQPASGMPASHSNPEHWGTYDAAVARSVRGRMAGVGYVLSSDDDLTGYDLDNCRDPDTGDIDPWAQAIVDLAETYCEVSPSETGLRLIAEGKVEAAIKRDPASVEVYGVSRYLTITGWHVPGTPTEIRPAPKTLAALKARVAEFDAAIAAERTGAQPDMGKPITEQNQRVEVMTSTLSSPSAGSSPFFRNVNSAALASLHSWVPCIFGAAARFQPSTGAFRVSSKALGRTLQEDLSIAPTGIRDWGIGDMGDARLGARTPIDLVISFGFEREAKDAAFWLCNRLGKDPESFGWNEGGAEGATIAQAILSARQVVKAPDGLITDAETGEVLSPNLSGPGDAMNVLELGRNVDWAQPKGLLNEIAEWIMNSARRPNRPLAVAAATAVISAVCGRHMFAPGGTALNLYVVWLAGTTVGKGRTFSAVAEILKAAGLGMLQTTAKGFSVSSVEQMIVDHPSCVATIDEIGANLLGRMSNKNSNTHEQAMRGALLELWSREQGQDSFFTHRRANSAPVEVPSPSLTIFGASTSEAFYGAVTNGSIRDGFLNRFLLAHAAPRAKSCERSQETRIVPPSIIEQLLRIIPNGLGNLQNALSCFMLHVKPNETRMEWDSVATKDRASQFEEEILDVMDASPEHASLMGRTFEYAVRLAAIHAISRGGRYARVTLGDLEWGAAWAIQSARAMINGAGSQMAASDYEQKFNAVRNALQTAGVLTRQDLLRQVRSVSAREREDIIKHLKEGGWIEEIKVPTEGRHALGWRWLG